MNNLEAYFNSNNHRRIVKLKHYLEIYDQHFSKFRNQAINILEIGIAGGGSLDIWKSYFGNQVTVYGIDIDPNCKNFEEERIKIFIGSQSDRTFLRELKKTIPKLDVIIDDCGHRMHQQIISFEELYDHVNEEGIYLCEDLHTSYWVEFGRNANAN